MDDSYYLELVLRDAESIITESEQKTLAVWLSESDSNVRKAEEVRALWFASVEDRELPEINPADDYQKIIDRIRGNNRYRPLFRILTMAAVGLLVLTAALFLFGPPWQSGKNLLFSGPLAAHRLPDNSLIWLDEGSKLLYAGKKQGREVELTGHAYFEVQPDTVQTFIVRTKLGTVEVLGTAFEVRADDTILMVEVASGQVQVKAGTGNVVLEKGSKATVTTAEILVDSLQHPVAAWRLSPIPFNEATLREVMATIELYYPFQYRAESEEVWDCRLNFTLHFPPVEELHLLLEALLEVQIEKGPGNQYLIRGRGCL